MYFLIGISLVFAYLYTINLIGSLAASALWKGVGDRAGRFGSRGLADLLFLLRVMPLACAAVLSFALLVPSFLRHEPLESGERVGFKLGLLVGISIVGLIAAGARIFGSWWRTRRLISQWLQGARAMDIAGFDLPAFVIEHSFPVLAVVGVLRPRIFVATQVLETLTNEELSAALAHEVGHVASRDNIKRLAMRLCGDMLVVPVGRSLDNRWLEATESAADDFAARQGLGIHALELASALVKIGRITPPGKAWELPAGAYLTEPGDNSLSYRVRDLIELAGRSSADKTETRLPARPFNLAAIALLAVLAFSAFSDSTLRSVHHFTEALLASLQ